MTTVYQDAAAYATSGVVLPRLPSGVGSVFTGLARILGELMAWLIRLTRREAAVVSTLERERLGSEVAAWLGDTRRLRRQLATLEREAHGIHEFERRQRAARGRRRVSRGVEAANFLFEVREVREMGEAWLARGRALPLAERERLGVDFDTLAELFELRWTLEIDEAVDQLEETRAVFAACRTLRRQLGEIEAALSSPDGGPAALAGREGGDSCAPPPRSRA